MDPWTLRRPIADFPEHGQNGIMSPKEYLKLKGRAVPGDGSDGEVVCLNDLDYQPVTNTEPSIQGGFTRRNIQDPDMPQLEFPEGIDVLRTIYRIDPDKWIPIETQTVCGKTPTPPGWVDLWNYRKALQSLKRDENGVIVEPIEAKFEPDAWQETHTPLE